MQGLRALAVVLVVLFHAGGTVVRGGFVGVDVFFVISGFVITGVLLRERSSTGSTSMLAFYGRRCRRIIPAATLVIVSTIILSYVFLGSLSGGRTAVDGKWAAVFLVNFHFASEGTNYLAAQELPSPLQNFWSLSVEEQFYVVYPTVFLLIAAMRTRFSLRQRLAAAFGAVIVASFLLSVVQTSSNPTVAFFSPWTRAWELALGGLVAIGTDRLLRMPVRLGIVLSWAGMAAILVSAFLFTSQSAYPGFLVALPAGGAALVMAGGAVASRHGAESVLGTPIFGWFGKLSYSLYLWHWPIFIIAAERRGKTSLTFVQNLPLIALALIASFLTFTFIEDPIRHAAVLRLRRWPSVILGVGLIVVSLVVATVAIDSHPQAGGATLYGKRVIPGTDAQVAAAVRASTDIQHLPPGLRPSLQAASTDYGAPPGKCTPTTPQTTVPSCVFGDPLGSRTVVLYGDSHALMWFTAVNEIATQAHWRLIILGKGYCKANKYAPRAELGSNIIYNICATWQDYALNRIKQIHPNLVIVTQEAQNGPNRQRYTEQQWGDALLQTFHAVSGPGTRFAVIGNIPTVDASPPDCLAEHPDQVQTCSGPYPTMNNDYDQGERRAVESVGGHYIPVTPWFCADRCSAVIGHFQPYLNQLHITATYSLYLKQVLAEQLRLAGLT